MRNGSSYDEVVNKGSGKFKVVKSFGSFKNESATLVQGWGKPQIT